jgi:Ribonuclease G/E
VKPQAGDLPSMPYCDGSGTIKSAATICYEILRDPPRRSDLSETTQDFGQTAPIVADLLLEKKAGFGIARARIPEADHCEGRLRPA